MQVDDYKLVLDQGVDDSSVNNMTKLRKYDYSLYKEFISLVKDTAKVAESLISKYLLDTMNNSRLNRKFFNELRNRINQNKILAR